MPPSEIARRLSETYAAALLFWPAVIAALEVPQESRWGVAMRLLLWTWVAVFALAASFGRRPAGPQFGLALTLGAAALAALWTLEPGGLRFAALAATILCFHAAERARLAEPARHAPHSPGLPPDAGVRTSTALKTRVDSSRRSDATDG